MNLLDKYAAWVRSGSPDQSGEELVESAIEWLKNDPCPDVLHVDQGYVFDCQVAFDDSNPTPAVVFSVESANVRFSRSHDFDSPKFISVQNKELAGALNDLVKNHLGLV